MYILDLIFIAVIGTLVGFLIGMSGKCQKKTINKVHFYLARDKNGKLWLYMGKPVRCNDAFIADLSKGNALTNISFRCFGLNESDYVNLKWEDEPVEVFLNLDN